MLAITIDQAKTAAVVATTALLVGSIAMFWIMKSVVQRIVGAGLLLILAFAVWTQRGALEDCADKVRASYERVGASVSFDDTECSFFGFSIDIADPRSG